MSAESSSFWEGGGAERGSGRASVGWGAIGTMVVVVVSDAELDGP